MSNVIHVDFARSWVRVVFSRVDRRPGDPRGSSWSARLHSVGAEAEARRMVRAYAAGGLLVVARVGGGS